MSLNRKLRGKPGFADLEIPLHDPDSGEVKETTTLKLELDAHGQVWEHRWVEYPIKPAVLIESDRFRSLLRELGIRVYVYWKPRRKKGSNEESSRFSEFDHCEVVTDGPKEKSGEC